MKAVACTQSKEGTNELVDIELDKPKATEHDLLVEIKAIAVNPIDYKTRQRSELKEGEYRVLGWDASGVVREIGPKVTQFKPGDEVWYPVT